MDYMKIGLMPPDQAEEWREAGYVIANEVLEAGDFTMTENHRGIPVGTYQMSERFVVETPNGVKRGEPGDVVTFDPERGWYGLSSSS